MVVLLAAAAGCRPSTDGDRRSDEAAAGAGDSNVIRIVSSLPRTGSAVAQTDTIVNGIKMAIEEANHQAGGFKIEYLDWDDATAAKG